MLFNKILISFLSFAFSFRNSKFVFSDVTEISQGELYSPVLLSKQLLAIDGSPLSFDLHGTCLDASCAVKTGATAVEAGSGARMHGSATKEGQANCFGS